MNYKDVIISEAKDLQRGACHSEQREETPLSAAKELQIQKINVNLKFNDN
jgi:hypothetical protein